MNELLKRLAENGKVETAEEKEWLEKLAYAFNKRMGPYDCLMCTVTRRLKEVENVKFEEVL